MFSDQDQRALWHRLGTLALLTWGFAGCHVLPDSSKEDASSAESDARQQALAHALDLRWGELMEDVEVDGLQSSEDDSPLAYRVSAECPLVYDFSIDAPLGPAIGRQSTGRVELRVHPEKEGVMELVNRATGLYPKHRGMRHPGKEWWHADITPVEVSLGDAGLSPASALESPWQLGSPALSLAALFPPLPKQASAVAWSGVAVASLGDVGAATASNALQVRVEERVRLGEERATVLGARGGERDLMGRYLLSEHGQIVAAAVVVPSGDLVASSSLRLTGACEGQRMPPASQPEDEHSAMIETWSRFSNAVRDAEWERALHYVDPALRETHGDDAIVQLLTDHLGHFGPSALGRISPSSPLSSDADHVVLQVHGRKSIAPGEAANSGAREVITEVAATRTQRGLRIARLRSTTDPELGSWELLDLSAGALRSSASKGTSTESASDVSGEPTAPEDDAPTELAPASQSPEVR